MKKLKFLTINLGCKVNAYELDCVKEELISYGFIEDKKHPDIIVINTCAVTHTAEKKSFQKFHSFRSKFPKSLIVIMGCATEAKKNEEDFSLADIVVGTNSKNKVVSYILDFLKIKKRKIDFKKQISTYQNFKFSPYRTRHRSYVKIQDGCNNFCSYCLIPFLRRGLQSRNKEEIFKEICVLEKSGTKEVVLAGIHVGKYGYEKKDNYHFYNLIRDLLEKFPNVNFRLSSLEVSEVDESFFKLFKTYKNLMPYLHIPLQSGCDKTLKEIPAFSKKVPEKDDRQDKDR